MGAIRRSIITTKIEIEIMMTDGIGDLILKKFTAQKVRLGDWD